MKEFVEKLISRLEECKKIEECNLYSGIEEGFGYSHCSDAFEDGQTLGAFNAYSSMLDFIKELAEEYNNDVCEWEITFDKDIHREYKPLCSEDGFIDMTGYFDYKYCPYCGKKIKVVE